MSDIPSTVAAFSRIEAVTVFETGAQVFRVATVSIAKGVSVVTFDGLPETLKRDTVQVAIRLPSDSAVEATSMVLKGIGVESVSTMNPQHLQLVTGATGAIEQRKVCEQELQALQDRLAQLKGDAKFMDGMWDKASAPNAKAEPSDLFDMTQWAALIDQRVTFVEASMGEVRGLERQIADLQEKIAVMNAQVSALAASNTRYTITQRASVTLSSPVAVEAVGLQISYMIDEAKWTPAYDVRVDSAQAKILLQYNAVVRQWSAEQWTAVRLQLSTAKPHVSSQQPTLVPWHIALHKPTPQHAAAAPGSVRFLSESRESASNLRSSAPPAMPAAVVESVTSQTFVVAGEHAVVNDVNKMLRVTLTQLSLPASFSHVTVPKASEVAFALALVTNSSEFFLLPGPTSVYLDEQYIAKSSLAKVSPGETFSVDVGRDDGVVVTRKTVKRMRSEEGNMLTGRKVKQEFYFDVKIVNRKQVDVEVEVKEAIPASGNADIVVKLLSPELSGDDRDTGCTLDDESILHFRTSIKAGNEACLSVAYRVTYPDDGRHIEGL